jgi:ATP-binding protein involved in chromosome partitioning
VPLLGRIPFDPTLARTFDKGVPLLDDQYPTIQRFQEIAGRIQSLLDYKKVLAEKL